MTAQVQVVGGIDPHADTIHVAAITAVGKVLGDAEFPTTTSGYRQAITFLTGYGEVERVGVEGAASYGAGITRALTAAGIDAVEVDRPTRSARRRKGKSDQLDAYHAARAVLAERTSPIKDPTLDGLRALNLARRSAVKAKTAAGNQINSILVIAPDPVRARFAGLTTDQLVTTLLRSRVVDNDQVAADITAALKTLAQRHRDLTAQIETLTVRIQPQVTARNPALIATSGVGPVVAAQLLITAGNNPDRLHSEASFAALCGVAPVPASSGKTRRYRLSRGGDRHANHALHRIALARMSNDPATGDYVRRHTDAGRSKKEILRKLKRAISREIHQVLTNPQPVPEWADLRPARQAKHLTLQTVADHFGVWPAHISTIERGLRRDDNLAIRYRAWLATAQPRVPPTAANPAGAQARSRCSARRTNDLDRAEHRHTIKVGGTPLYKR
jgi:transposase